MSGCGVRYKINAVSFWPLALKIGACCLANLTALRQESIALIIEERDPSPLPSLISLTLKHGLFPSKQ